MVIYLAVEYIVSLDKKQKNVMNTDHDRVIPQAYSTPYSHHAYM